MHFAFPTIEWLIQAAIFMDLVIVGVVFYCLAQALIAWRIRFSTITHRSIVAPYAPQTKGTVKQTAGIK